MASLADRTRNRGSVDRRARVRVWRWPLVLAALSLFGLLSALLGQGGVWWVLSWLSLATPLAVIGRYV